MGWTGGSLRGVGNIGMMKRVLVTTPRTYGGQQYVYSGDDLSCLALASHRIGYVQSELSD